MQDDALIQQAAALIGAGEVVAVPTETVYGLACDPLSESAIAALFALKERPADVPLSVLIAAARDMDSWALDIPAQADLLAQAFWPGPLTIVLKKKHHVPELLTAGLDSIGLRIPDHPLTLGLLIACGGALACTSANIHGQPSQRDAQEVRSQFGERLPLVLDGGPSRLGRESSIVDLCGQPPVLLREGALSRLQIEEVLGEPVLLPGESC